MENKDDKKKAVYKNPRSLADIQRSIFSNTGLQKKDYKGRTIEDEEEWQIKGGVAKYPKVHQSKLDRKKSSEQRDLALIPTPPKLGVSQVKNIDTLGYMLQRENWKREKAGKTKTAEFEFDFKDYAKMRGRTETELARGGKFLDELKKDLFTGAYTTYRLDRVEIDGKLYTAHGLPNIYILLEPDNHKGNWKVIYNEPYKNYYINGKQYYPVLLQAIQDKNTDDRKGYLYFFFKIVMSYASTKPGFARQLKVITLLDKITISDGTKARPREAFKVLCECIYYTADNYKAIKEVRFFNNWKCEKVKIINDLEKFKKWDYNDFTKEVLTPLGLTDFRDALISFNAPPTEATEGTEETGQTGQDIITL